MTVTIHHRSSMLLEIEKARESIMPLITGTTPMYVRGINLQRDWRRRGDIVPRLVIMTTTLLPEEKSMSVTIAETFPLVGNCPHRNEVMITDSHHHNHVLQLRTIENVIVIMTGDFPLPLPVQRGCMTCPLPMREIIPLRHTTGVVHHHLWVQDMNIRREREKVRTKIYIIMFRYYLSIVSCK